MATLVLPAFPIPSIFLTYLPQDIRNVENSGSFWVTGQRFPPFIPPQMPAFLLGDKRMWPSLKAYIFPYINCPVLSSAEDEVLKEVQNMFETERYPTAKKWAVIHDMLGNDGGGDNPEIVEVFAALGSDFDLPTEDGLFWRPIHFCAVNGRADALKVLIDCRVDVNAVTGNLQTALTLAEIWLAKAEQTQTYV